jgi:mRNA-degrading endonuclease YafQ of YafQ-DinJ toxin-antitoxin module
VVYSDLDQVALNDVLYHHVVQVLARNYQLAQLFRDHKILTSNSHILNLHIHLPHPHLHIHSPR